MKITVKLISQINSATKPLACDCFDLRGRTRSRCPVCDGKGGMKSCSTCGSDGMSPDSSRQVRVCSEFKGTWLFAPRVQRGNARADRKETPRTSKPSCNRRTLRTGRLAVPVQL